MASLISSLLTNRELIYTQSNVSVRQIVELMASNKIGAVIVQDEDALVGIISERDIVRKVVNQGLNPDATTAADIVYSDVTILDKNEPVSKAMQVVTDTRRRHVLVSSNGEVVDIVSIGDLMLNVLSEQSNTIEQLENYIYS